MFEVPRAIYGRDFEQQAIRSDFGSPFDEQGESELSLVMYTTGGRNPC